MLNENFSIIIIGVISWLFLLTALSLYIIFEPSANQDNYENQTIVYIVSELKDTQKVEPGIEEEYFYRVDPIKLPKEEIQCLKRNVFFEAGIEPYEGKLAVAQVTINRLNTGRWGQSVCSVVYARAQFSWTLWKKNRTKVPSGPLWEDSKRVVQDFLDGVRIADINNSLHYHADYIEPPNWADPDRRIAQIGQHVFYER